jgi:hypothetical protein
MRVTTEQRSGFTQRHTVDFDGRENWADPQIDQRYERTVQRSDITINLRNPVTGWRKPSGYTVLDNSISFEEVEQISYTQRINTGQIAVSVLSGPCTWIPRFSLPFWQVTNEFDNLTTKALIKARDQKVNLALSVLEMHKTIDLVAGRVLQLYNGYRAARKGNFAKAAEHLGVSYKRKGKTQAKNWLELQYGWLPVLSDIKGAYDEMTRVTRNKGLQFKVTARDKVTHTSVGNSSVYGYDISGEALYLCEAQAIYWFQVENEWLLTQSAIGLANPVEIAWELIPFSFVVDWALPVGDYLAALTAQQGLSFMGGTHTFRTTVETTYTSSPWPPESVPNAWGGPQLITREGTASVRMRDKSVLRYALSQKPWPELPSFKNPISTGHALNALALLRSIF